MKSITTLSAIAALGFAHLAHAAYPNQDVALSYSSVLRSDDGKHTFTARDEVRESQGIDPVSGRLEASVPAKTVHKLDTTLTGSAADQAVDVTLESRWADPGFDGFNADLLYVGAGATTQDVAGVERGGFIRFKVDYDLFADGAGTTSRVDFGGNAFFAAANERGFDYLSTAFQLTVDGSGGPDRKTGTWESEWLPISAAADFPTSWRTSYGYTLNGWSKTQLDAGQLLGHGNGTSNAYARATLSFEVAPVPEPETYALTAVGLVGVALARRFKGRSRKEPAAA